MTLRDETTSDQELSFGETIKARRRALDLSQDNVYAAGGPSPTTLVRWERGDPLDHDPRPRILRRLDTALRWSSGTAFELYHGTITPDEALRERGTDSSTDGRDSIDAVLDPSNLVEQHGHRLTALIRKLIDRDNLADEQDAGARLLLTDLAQHSMISTLEKYDDGDELPEYLPTLVLAVHGADRPSPGTPQHDRWRYLMWLAGEATDPQDIERFQRHRALRHRPHPTNGGD